MKEALISRDLALQQLKHNHSVVQHHMKEMAYWKHTEQENFQVGDMVFLKLQPCQQVSVSACTCQKLTPRYYEPFKILQHVGHIAYYWNSKHPLVSVIPRILMMY